MNRTALAVGMLITWTLLIVFYQIEHTIGVRVDVIPCAAGVSLLYGLYEGLYATNKYEQTEGES